MLLQRWARWKRPTVGEDRAIGNVKLDQRNSKVKKINMTMISYKDSIWQMKVISTINLSLKINKRVAKLSNRLVKRSEVRVSRASLDASSNNLWIWRQNPNHLKTLRTSRYILIVIVTQIIYPQLLQNCLAITEPRSISCFNNRNLWIVLAPNYCHSRLSNSSRKSKRRQLCS